jgi:hypothetical protein
MLRTVIKLYKQLRLHAQQSYRIVIKLRRQSKLCELFSEHALVFYLACVQM